MLCHADFFDEISFIIRFFIFLCCLFKDSPCVILCVSYQKKEMERGERRGKVDMCGPAVQKLDPASRCR